MTISQDVDTNVKPEFFVNKLKNNEPFKFIRWGDGEWKTYFDIGRSAEYKYNRHGAKDLRRCIDGDFYYGIQNMALKKFGNKIPKRKWINADMFHYAARDGKLNPLFRELRKKHIVFIGPEFLKAIEKYIPYKHWIEVPPRDCYTVPNKERVKKEILEYGKKAIYIFCCAYMANVVIYEIWKEDKMKGSTMIDLGSLFDQYAGKKSRGYMRKMSKENYLKNIDGL
jgi:hypothetical protein